MGKEIERTLVPYVDIMIGDDFNSRKTLKNIEGLAQSLDENSLIQPIVVREGGPSKVDGRRKVFLIAGERRYRAIGLLRDPQWTAKDADGKEIPRKTTPAAWNSVEAKFVKKPAPEMSIINLIENLQREGLDPLEEAEAMHTYMETYKCSQDVLAHKLGKSSPYVSQRLSLLKHTAPEVKKALEDKTITATHAREIIALPPAQQKAVIKEVQARVDDGKKVSVAAVKEMADKHKSDLGIQTQTRTRTKDGDGVEYDKVKIDLAKEIYEGKSMDVRPKAALLEQLGALIQRAQNPRISDETKIVTKAQVAVIEYMLKLRDTL
jgi:ParB-like chromosome segregation protein Spo0J